MLQKIFYLNQQGKRKNIEDSLYPSPDHAKNSNNVFLVCDGVGGESKGEEASRIVCETMGNLLDVVGKQIFTKPEIKETAVKAVEQLQEYAALHPGAENMSTTLTLAIAQQDGVWVAWCGDSRVYHIRAGKVLWRTKDHSLVQQLIEAGEITEEEAMHHPRKNIILRSLSASSNKAEISIHFIDNAQKGDYILLCTDGILERIGEVQLYDILNPGQKEGNKARLFLNYCEGKTSDNFSMYLLQLGDGINNPIKGATLNKKTWLWAVLFLGAMAVMYFLFGIKKNEKQQSAPVPAVVKNDTAHSTMVPLPTINVAPKGITKASKKIEKISQLGIQVTSDTTKQHKTGIVPGSRKINKTTPDSSNRTSKEDEILIKANKDSI